MSEKTVTPPPETAQPSTIEEKARATPQAPERSPWWLVAGGFFILFNIWGLLLSFGAFQEFYALTYIPNYSSSTISWIGTVQGALMPLMGFISGPLYDLGYWPILLSLGSFLIVFGMMMLSLSTQYSQIFLSQAVCVGLGSGMLFIPLYTAIGAAFTEKRAIAMGIITSGIALGGIIFTILYLRLLPTIGFAWMVRVIGFINLVTFAVAIPLMLTRPKNKKGGVRKLLDKAMLTDPAFLLFTAIQLFMYLGYLVPVFYIPTFSEVALKSSQSTGLYILVGFQAGSLFGRLGTTYPVPYTGVMLPWVICCSISGVLCFAWLAIKEQPGFIAFSVLFGVFSGALIALPPALFPVICPDPSKLGARMGVSWLAAAMATLLGSPLAGLTVNVQEGDFFGIQIWSGVMLIFATLLLIILWGMLWKKQGKFLV